MAVATGKFQLVEGDDANFDKIMEAAGVSADKRAKGTSIKPAIEYSREGELYKVTYSVAGAPDRSHTFSLDTEVEETTLDGRKVKSLYKRNGNVITQHEKQENGKEVVYVREMKGDELHVSITCGGLSARRIFKKM